MRCSAYRARVPACMSAGFADALGFSPVKLEQQRGKEKLLLARCSLD